MWRLEWRVQEKVNNNDNCLLIINCIQKNVSKERSYNNFSFSRKDTHIEFCEKYAAENRLHY